MRFIAFPSKLLNAFPNYPDPQDKHVVAAPIHAEVYVMGHHATYQLSPS